MKKKVFAVLLAMLLCLSALPTAALAADLPSYFDSYEDVVAAGITDEAFAKLVFDTISADENFDLTAYSSAAAVLAAYDGEIKLKAEDDTIEKIDGINILTNARIIIENAKIIDLMPLGTAESRGEAVSVNGNPIYLWPASIPDVPESGNTYSIPTAFFSNGKAVYINDGTAKTQTVNFMVKVDGATKWDVNASNKLTTTGEVSTDDTISADLDKVVWNVAGPGSGLIKMSIPKYEYETITNPQTLWPAYQFTLESVFYDTLKVNVEAASEGGFYLVKYKAGTENTDEPVVVAGATYGLFTDEECKTPVVKADDDLLIETAEEPVLVDGLLPGTYYLKEVIAAPKYNLSDEVVEIVIGEAEAAYKVDGVKTIKVTPDRSNWQNDWYSNTNLTKLALVCTDDAVEAVAGEGTYKDYALFIGGPEVYDVKELALDNDAEKTGFEVEYAGAVIKYGNETVELDAEDDLVAAVNGLIEDKVGNIEVTLKADFSQLLDPAKDTVVVTDEPITIWVENTTGDEKGTPGFKKDAGGYVYICLDEEGTKSRISSDEPVNKTGDDNSVNRQECYLACGVADEGWKVAVDKIQVGSMGADGKSGALTYITALPAYTDGAEEYYDEATGEFRFFDEPSQKYISGILHYSEEEQKACVEITDMDQNIDVAIPFYKEAPQTGMDGMILFWSMLLVGAVYVMAAFRKARKAL